MAAPIVSTVNPMAHHTISADGTDAAEKGPPFPSVRTMSGCR